LAHVPLYPVLGNHDKNGRPYFDLFDLPSDHEQWYAFTYGSVRFIALNTSASFGTESSQYAWLVEELQSEETTSAAWQIVFFHHPVFSSGVEYFAAGDMEELFPPLFEQYGVDIVFSGHEHNYERSEKNGVIYVVTGGGGAPLYGHAEDPLAQNPYSLVRFTDYHHCVLDITPEQIIYTVLDNDGTVRDEFTLAAE
jgi:predicted phosphodiesterase